MTEFDDLHHLLDGYGVPEPSPTLATRTLAAAAPILAAHARRVSWRAWLRPLAAALVPLPLVVALNVLLARALYALATTVLPAAVGTYVVAQYTLFLVLVLGATYAAVPLLAERQLRAALEESHV